LVVSCENKAVELFEDAAKTSIRQLRSRYMSCPNYKPFS
jgi:hypothetical protein